MGRSGGGGGGGRSGGGSFGGSRSSGGRMGGSFGGSSRSGGFGGSFGRGSGSSFGGGSSHSSGGSGFRFGGGGYHPFGGGGASGCGTPGGCGCGVIPAILIIILILAIIFASNLGSGTNNNNNSNNSITTSTIEREPLPKGSVNETAYYTDELGWIGNQTELLRGLKYFYQETGVQPYLYITDNINGSHPSAPEGMSDFANDKYDELFTDEAHILLIFYEYNDNYMDWYVCGTRAKTVIDSEAADILLDYIDRNYYDESLTDEEFFSNSFSDAADRIMKVTRSPWIVVFVVLGILALIAVLFIWWKNVKKQKNLEAKQTEEILKTPLEKFGDKEAEDLADKYEDKDNK